MLAWLPQLPAVCERGGGEAVGREEFRSLYAFNLGYQMCRQRAEAGKPPDTELYELANDLIDLATHEVERADSRAESVPEFLTGLISLAEFLAREARG